MRHGRKGFVPMNQSQAITYLKAIAVKKPGMRLSNALAKVAAMEKAEEIRRHTETLKTLRELGIK